MLVVAGRLIRRALARRRATSPTAARVLMLLAVIGWVRRRLPRQRSVVLDGSHGYEIVVEPARPGRIRRLNRRAVK